MGFGFLFKVKHHYKYILLQLFVIFGQLNFPLSILQVDEQSLFRHRGERKVKTVEEDMEEVTSTTAALLNEDGEELMGSYHKRASLNSLSIESCSGV